MRIGMAPYVNTLPYSLPLAKQYSLTLSPPSSLNKKMREGMIDVALCSSVVSFDPSFDLIEDFGLASKGPILSVNLYSSMPLEALTGQAVALDPESETSNLLFKVLCANFWNISPIFVDPTTPHVAKVIIGDKALKYHHLPLHVSIDLGSAWYQMTALPFVFARFIAKKGSETTPVRAQLDNSLEWSRKHQKTIIDTASFQLQLPALLLDDYFKHCIYRIGELEMRGFNTFRNYVSALPNTSDLCCYC